MNIVTREEWGFDGWARDDDGRQRMPYFVDERQQRTEWFGHYEGAAAVLDEVGPQVPRAMHAFHKSRGWKGIGYGHVIDAEGTIFEGRGFDLTGSHCEGHNTSAYSVQLHLGGNEKPTDAQLAAARWLYDEACRRSGRTLLKRGHRDGFATSCPGDHVYAWIRAGMPAPTTEGDDDMQLTDPLRLTEAQKRTLNLPDGATVNDALIAGIIARQRTNRILTLLDEPDDLAKEIAQALPAGVAVDDEQLARVLRSILGSLDDEEVSA